MLFAWNYFGARVLSGAFDCFVPHAFAYPWLAYLWLCLLVLTLGASKNPRQPAAFVVRRAK